ncbi:MAG: hypothetical protein RQ729_12665 [Wenzhouxiangellaceae bacterium]|nr:hypothetical protein [Wenzhouxiangellaceae bacterium]
MDKTSNKTSAERKSQPAQATQGGVADKQMGASSGNKGKSPQPQQQTRFTQQHDAGKSRAAPAVDKNKSQPENKEVKSC